MRIHPDYLGKGYGSEIQLHLEKSAKVKNYKTLILETDEKLAAAIKLYEKNGFIFRKKEFIDGFDCLWYRKKLFKLCLNLIKTWRIELLY